MFRYASCFCEENIWWLCQETRFAQSLAEVVFISNPERCCAMFGQKAATVPDGPVFWDYHVVLCVHDGGGHEVWDLDCKAGTPLGAREWLTYTFEPAQKLPEIVWPLFRLIPASQYVENFSSNRAHMLNEEGNPLMPFPSWPAISNRESNLFQFVDMQNSFLGDVIDLEGVKKRWSA